MDYESGRMPSTWCLRGVDFILSEQCRQRTEAEAYLIEDLPKVKAALNRSTEAFSILYVYDSHDSMLRIDLTSEYTVRGT